MTLRTILRCIFSLSTLVHVQKQKPFLIAFIRFLDGFSGIQPFVLVILHICWLQVTLHLLYLYAKIKAK